MAPGRDDARTVHHRVRLGSGDDVLVRSLQAGDAEGLGRLFDELSGSSRYQRFLGGKPAVSPRALQRLVDVDHRDHEALVALSGDGHGGGGGDGVVVGEARFVRDAEEPTVAEMAITVADAWQRRGLGTALAHTLAHRAAEEGVDEFSAEVLADNAGIRRLVEQVGEVSSAPLGSGVSVLRVATAGHDEPLRDADGLFRRVMRSAASGDFLVLPTPLRWGLHISGEITKTILVPVRVLLRRR
jgi:RimJ/RimL family protein N-acetyltransferase